MPGAPLLAYFARSGIAAQKPSSIPCRQKVQTAPEIPRPFARTDKSVTRQGNTIIIELLRSKSSYFKEGRTLPSKPSTRP